MTILFNTGIYYELNRKLGNNKLLEPNNRVEGVNSFRHDDKFILFIITENKDVANGYEWKRLYHIIKLEIFLYENVCI